MGTSQAGSIKGWKFKVWWERNKEYVKNIGAVGISMAVYFIGDTIPAGIREGVSGALALVLKIAFDTVDFWLSDVKVA
jgi:hypothetical protein